MLFYRAQVLLCIQVFSLTRDDYSTAEAIVGENKVALFGFIRRPKTTLGFPVVRCSTPAGCPAAALTHKAGHPASCLVAA